MTFLQDNNSTPLIEAVMKIMVLLKGRGTGSQSRSSYKKSKAELTISDPFKLTSNLPVSKIRLTNIDMRHVL